MKAPLVSLFVALIACQPTGETKSPTAAQWQSETKASLRDDTPQAEQDLQAHIASRNDYITRSVTPILEQTQTLDGVLLGETAQERAPGPVAFDASVRFCRKYVTLPKLLPFEERRLKTFFEDLSKADQAKLAKLYNQKKVLEDFRLHFSLLQADGYQILLAQNQAVGANWFAELHSLLLASEVLTFEHQFESKASEATLAELADTLTIRNQSRAMLATQTAMLAAFEGVIAGGNPQAVLELAKLSRDQVGTPTPATTEDARALVGSISTEALDVAAALEVSMRQAHGDKNYEHAYQEVLVSVLEQIEKAQDEASLYEIVDEQARMAKAAEVEQRRKTTQERLIARAKELGTDKAREVFAGLPYGQQFLAGADAVEKLREGDPRGALEAAAEAAPSGPIGSGIKAALGLAFAGSAAIKRRRPARHG
jgi:hypothetical protein